MKIHAIRPEHFAEISVWNRQLQIDEGSLVMSLEEIERRMKSWFSEKYSGCIFDSDGPVGYAIYRPTDFDSEGERFYLRQFFVAKEHRQKGYATQAFHLMVKEIFKGQRVILEVLETNPQGRKFWNSVGLKPYCTKLELT